MSPEQAAQAQLDAYNARDIDAFLKPYHEDVELARFPSGEVFARGHADMRRIYGEMFANTPELHCRLVSRMCHGRFVIDQEDVAGMEQPVRAVAIYEVEDGRIRRAWFVR
jgi:hypothetical protein